jgi:hypothetical protein
MTCRQSWYWGLAIGSVAVLDIIDVLPDWTTITAVLTLGVMGVARCHRVRQEVR